MAGGSDDEIFEAGDVALQSGVPADMGSLS
jgi:hypothetical protein